jgi:NhaP-type Na+/H+ or K+/H+ antiporter
MSDQDVRMEEYRHLYQEIGRNSQISQNVFLGNVAVTAGLIGYGLESSSGPIFLAPFAIIVPSLFFLASQLESTTRIAAYIVVYFEDQIAALQWESRWLAIRQIPNLLPSKRKYTLSVSGLYGMVSAVCLLLALAHWDHAAWSYLLVASPIVVLVVQGVSLIIHAFSLNLVEEYVTSWRGLREQQADASDAA